MMNAVQQTPAIRGWHGLAIAALAFVLMLPAITHGIFDANDLPSFHLRWAKQFSDQWWAGDLYPRWLLQMNGGFGSPTFFFYAPVPYFFTSLLRPLVLWPDPSGWHQLLLGAYVALVASGLTAYLWLRPLTNATVALGAALLYLVLPYHLAFDLYWRFAYAEFWSFVWFPLILYFTQQWLDGRRSEIGGFAVCQALLIMTHLPSFLMFSLVPILYALWMAPGRQRLRVMIGLGVGFGLAVGLAAIYWVPAMTMQHTISMKLALEQAPFFQYQNNFLFPLEFSNPTEILRPSLAVATTLTLEIGLCAYFIIRRHTPAQVQRQARFWVVLALAAFFMVTPLTLPLWQALPTLQKVQFPWRFNTVLTIAVVALVALALTTLKQAPWPPRRYWTVLAVGGCGVVVVLSAIALIPSQNKMLWPLNRETPLWLGLINILAFAVTSLYWPVNLRRWRTWVIISLLTLTLLLSSGVLIKKRLFPPYQLAAELAVLKDAEEYRPPTVPQSLYSTEGLRSLAQTFPTQARVEQGTVQIQQWQPRHLKLEVNAPTPSLLTLKQFYYPGWHAVLVGSSAPLTPQPSQPEGLLQVRVPPGQHQVALTLAALAPERIGRWVSALAVLATLLLGVWFRQLERPALKRHTRPFVGSRST